MVPLVHVVYASEATTEFTDKAVRELLERARRNNAALGITGILLLVGRSFFQILEGAPELVTAVFDKIGLDKRHKRVSTLIREPIEKRDFADWSMGLARVTSKELALVPGFNDFFATSKSLDRISEGLARSLLAAFREGRFRAQVGD
jgi:hypothetical protein